MYGESRNLDELDIETGNLAVITITECVCVCVHTWKFVSQQSHLSENVVSLV